MFKQGCEGENYTPASGSGAKGSLLFVSLLLTHVQSALCVEAKSICVMRVDRSTGLRHTEFTQNDEAFGVTYNYIYLSLHLFPFVYCRTIKKYPKEKVTTAMASQFPLEPQAENCKIGSRQPLRIRLRNQCLEKERHKTKVIPRS